MESTEIKIRARKISELDNFIEEHNVIDDGDEAYVILAYVKDGAKENYKISLKNFITVINESADISDQKIKEKILAMFDGGEIELPVVVGPQGIAGPQGPAGPKGSEDISWDEIQAQINALQALINSYHTNHVINYHLYNISPNEDNVSYLTKDGTAILYFIPHQGYKMPNSVTISGAEFTYDQNNASIYLHDVHENSNSIDITMSGELKYFSMSINFTNITYEITSGEATRYCINNFIELQLSCPENYVLPDSINLIGANKVQYVKDTGLLQIRCNGTENISISGSAIRLCKLKTNLTDITCNYDQNTTYIAGDEINIKLIPNNGFALPMRPALTVVGASVINYNQETGDLSLRCVGTGDMLIRAAGVQLDTYYFGICGQGVNDDQILTYENGVITGITITDDFISSHVCPLPEPNTEYEICEENELGANRYDIIGEVYIILPSKYFDIETFKFVYDNGNKYNIWTGSFQPNNLDADDIKASVDIDGEQYLIITIAYEGIGRNYIEFK